MATFRETATHLDNCVTRRNQNNRWKNFEREREREREREMLLDSLCEEHVSSWLCCVDNIFEALLV